MKERRSEEKRKILDEDCSVAPEKKEADILHENGVRVSGQSILEINHTVDPDQKELRGRNKKKQQR